MTSYIYKGYGVTDSNGVAHLDHDPQGNPINGYTGTGAGEVDIIASTDNPITSSSIVSETYEVLDTIFYDKGLEGTGNHNDNWYGLSGVTCVRDGEGTTISKTASGNAYITSKNQTYYDVPLAVEFEVISVSNVRLLMEDTTIVGLSDNDVVKVTVKDGYVTIYKNGTPQTPVAKSFSQTLISWQMVGASSLKYKNFRVYPI